MQARTQPDEEGEEVSKPILCLNFDGVIHSYSSGWKGATVIPDPPVAGALDFIDRARDHFIVAIFSSRSNQVGGKNAMVQYLQDQMTAFWNADKAIRVLLDIEFPSEKPAAFVTIDDRALTFDGTWPRLEDIKAFQPWHKRPFGATGDFPQGQLSDDDQGGIKIGIAYDKIDGIVRVEFGKPIAWLGLPPPQAIELARYMLKCAGAKKIEIEL
jgi:hypothetical protein